MAYRKRTLRVMSPTARKVARLIGELDSISRRLKHLVPELQELDFERKALKVATVGLTLPDVESKGLEVELFSEGMSLPAQYGVVKGIERGVVYTMSKGRNTTVLSLRVPDSVYARVKVLAAKEGWSVNDWMKAAVLRAAGLLADGSIRSHHKRGCGGSEGYGVYTMIGRVYGGIRRERVEHNVPVLVSSRVSLAEAVAVWMESVRKCNREAQLDCRLDAWQGRKRGV